MNKKNVAVLTTFGSWDEAYSPCNVVRYQIHSLVKHGYLPTLITLDCFPKDRFMAETDLTGFELLPVLPTLRFEPYQGIAASRQVPSTYEKDVAKIVPVYNQYLKNFDVLLCQDIIFQDSFLPYNGALRKYVMPPQQKLYHWMHSGPSIRPEKLTPPIEYLYSLPPQSKLVYMNNYDIVRAAEMYGTLPPSVRIVHNPIDYRYFPHIHPLVKTIIDDYGLNAADIVAVYPLSTTRMGAGGKQLQKAIKIMGFLKGQGKNVKYIIPNAHANGDREKQAIGEMLALGAEYGLIPNDLIFTSTLGKEYEGGVPHEVVVQLFQYSDLFIFPSVSENCPLVLLEAALAKNLLVLNEDFSPMKDFVGSNALYFKFDSVNTVTSHPNGEDAYFKDIAIIINSLLQTSREYKSKRDIRQKFNVDYIFKNQLEPLFYE